MGLTLGVAYKLIDVGLGCTSAEEDNTSSAVLDLYCLISKYYMGEHYTAE